MLPRNNPDRIRIIFDDHRLVANARLLLPATLARHLGLRELVDHHLDLGSAPGRASTGDKIMTLVASALAGGDCINDADAMRTGGTACTLGGTVKAPSTLGTFLRSFRWGPRPSARPCEPPVADPGLTATLNSDGSITLTWSAPDDGSVTGYHVLLRRPKEGEKALIVYVSDMGNTSTTYTDTGTDLDPRYGYHVKAKNAHGLSDVSNFARIDT